MNLESLLDHVAHHILDDRSELLSGASDELFSDELLTRYLNEGQDKFCKRAWPIIDESTAAVCVLTPVAGQKTYSLHKSVLKVLSAIPADTDIPLVWINHDLIAPRPQNYLPDYYQTAPIATVDTLGRPGWFSTDEETRVLRLRPAPDATAVSDMGTINLRVARLPVTYLDVSVPTGEPEIPEEYHLKLCLYAAGCALKHPNVDSGDARQEGERLLADFYGELRLARNDRMIAQNAPGRYLFGGWAR